MCYNVSYLTKQKIQYARRFGSSDKDIAELEKQLELLENRTPPTYHAHAWAHPDIPVITRNGDTKVDLMEWGLIPSFVRDVKTAYGPKSNYPNCVGETMFEKAVFKEHAYGNRCIVMVDGFFEHHHEQVGVGKNSARKQAYYIRLKDDGPMALAGIWRQVSFVDETTGQAFEKTTCSIVTTQANQRMAQLHNNPVAIKRNGPRMPAIIPKGMEDAWLSPSQDPVAIEAAKSCLTAYPADELEDWPVGTLLGKHAIGNQPKAVAKVVIAKQGDLFG